MLITSTRDPSVPLTDIQWVMGHAHLSTTEVYLNPQLQDVVETMLAARGLSSS